MIFERWRHKGSLNYRHSHKRPKESPSRNKYVANFCPWPVSMPEEVGKRSREPVHQIPRNVWLDIVVDVKMPIPGLQHIHLVLNQEQNRDMDLSDFGMKRKKRKKEQEAVG